MNQKDLKKALEQKSKTIEDIVPIPTGLFDNKKWISLEDALDLFSVFQKDHEQENAVRIEQIKDEKNTKINALQLAILTIYKPEIEKLKRKLDETHSLVKDNVHVPRKQLEDLDKGFPSINSRKYYENGTMDYIKWATDVIRWRGKFQDFRFGLLEKELLEATQK